MPAAGEVQGEVVARCYRHPDREALIRCTRCDRPICPECMRPASVGFHCPDDVEQARRTVRAPRTSVGATLIRTRPYVTVSLVGLNVLAYLAAGLGSGGSLAGPAGARLFQDWQLYPQAVHADHQYYRLLTSAFLHFTLLHIGANMLALIFVGPALEQLLGRWRFATIYLGCAFAGGVTVYAFGSPLVATAGASGAIFGLFGACLVLVRRLGLDPQWLIGTLVLNFVLTFAVPGISWLDHVGGFVAGVLMALAIGGLPARRNRVATPLQVAGLVGVVMAAVLIAAIRTASW